MADDTDDTGGLRGLLSAWAGAKRAEWRVRKHQLQTRLEDPESLFDSGGKPDIGNFDGKRAKRSTLEDYHDIRTGGGIVASLLEARALMVFGVGGEYVAEQDGVSEWLNDQFESLALTALDIGSDALFYGYSLAEIRETQAGDFGKLEFIEPWTTVPTLDNKGEITAWEQEISHGIGTSSATFDPEDIYHFTVAKSSGRDPVGMSWLGLVMDEATAYKENQDAIQNAVTLHGFPKWHVKVGPEDGAVIDDNELRRTRPKFDNITELTKWVTGQDVDIDVISPEGFDFESITEHDLSKLAIALMLPIEITQIGGGDGLGTGFPARLRERLFLLSATAQQERVSHDLLALGKDLLREYAPPDIEALAGDIDEFDLSFEFDDPITDMDELQSKVDAIGDDMTVNERRAMFDLPALDDDEIGEQFGRPARTEEPEPDPFGGDDPALVELQNTGSLSSDVISMVRDYASQDGTLDDSIQRMAEWVDDFADEPATAVQRLREGVTVFANAQGIGVGEAVEQPVQRLLSYYAENRNLQADPDEVEIDESTEALLEEIEAYRGGFESIVWADHDVELAGPTFSGDGDVPANVRNRLPDASRFVNWGDTEGVPPGNLRDYFVSKLEQPQGWSIQSLSNGLRDQFGARMGEPEERVNIARTKSAALLNQAKRMAFEDLEEGIEGRVRYYWDGPQDDDTTDACEELKQLTNPEHGGTPRPRPEFDELMADIRQDHFPDFESSGDAIHWQERHALDAVLPQEADDVDPAGVGGLATDPGAADD